MFARLREWVRGQRRPPTPEELEAREEGRRLLDDKETYRVLDRFGPRDVSEGTRRDTGRID